MVNRVQMFKIYLVAVIVYVGYQLKYGLKRNTTRSEQYNKHVAMNTSPHVSRQLTTGVQQAARYTTCMHVTSPPQKDVYLDKVESWFNNISTVDRFLNKHEFVYQQQSKMCDEHLDIIIFVHSATQNMFKRDTIRRTWGSIKRIGNMTVATVFMLGQTQDEKLQRNITSESNTHGDIVQGNFLDTYKNLTYKHIMALHWIVTTCPDAKTVLKVDDDIFVNVFKLNTDHIPNSLYCNIFYNTIPIRTIGHKTHASKDEYPFNRFHDYCSGWTYITSVNEIRQLLECSKFTRFFWVEDEFVTGVLVRMAGIKLVQFANGDNFGRLYTDGAMLYEGSNLRRWKSLWAYILFRQIHYVTNYPTEPV